MSTMTNSPRTILVTGADGRIGRATVHRLRTEGRRVIALAPRFRHLSEDDAELHLGSATDEHAVADALDGVDAVVHLAAIPHWDHGTPYEVFSTNVLSTFNVLTQAAARGIKRAVIASSLQANGVQGNHRGLLPAYYPIDEDLEPVHDEAYSLSKSVDELTARMIASRHDMTVVALRFPWTDDAASLRAVAAEWAADPSAGAQLGWSYLEVRDAAAAVSVALDAPLTGATVIQLAAPTTLLDLDTETLLDRYAPDVPRRTSMPGRTVPVSIERQTSLLGFRPAHEVAPTTGRGE